MSNRQPRFPNVAKQHFQAELLTNIVKTGVLENMNVLFAYFDPTAGSLLLQALVGGFGGIAVLGRYLWGQMQSTRANQTDLNS